MALSVTAVRFFVAARLHFRHLHAHGRGQVLHRIYVAQPAVGHQEADGVAVRAAAKAVIELLRRADGERGRLLVMERAQALVIRAALFQAHVA